MPIETKHPQWETSIYAWQKSRDCMGGEKIIKSKNTKYLDIPGGMLTDSTAPSSGGSGTQSAASMGEMDLLPGDERQYDPTWHPNAAYRAYLRRAKFPDIVAFTIRGLIGIATKKPPLYELPSGLEYLEETFTKCGKSIEEFYKFAINEVLQTGRLTCVVDIGDDNKFQVVPYRAESNINWGKDLCVFEEQEPKNPDDPFSHESQEIYHVFFIDPKTGLYDHGMLKSGEKDLPERSEDEEVDRPNHMGKTYEKLPIVYFGSTNLDNDVDQIPVEGIADCAIQIYRKSADLSQSQYLSCNPTLYGIGVDADDKPTATGSTVVWLISNEDAKIGYTQTDTSALNHVSADMESLFEEAANYGAQLLGSPKKGAESAESIRLQQTAGGATLASVIDTVSQGIQNLVDIMLEWSVTSGEFEFEGSKEFTDMTFSAGELKELRESVMSGMLSQETYLYNVKRAGLFPDDHDVDDELDLIDLGKALDELPSESEVRSEDVEEDEDETE